MAPGVGEGVGGALGFAGKTPPWAGRGRPRHTRPWRGALSVTKGSSSETRAWGVFHGPAVPGAEASPPGNSGHPTLQGREPRSAGLGLRR